MNDSLMDWFRLKMEETKESTGAHEDSIDDLGSFGWLRGVRDRALMLELRLRSGNVVALGYPWLERVEFDPSEGVMLSFTGKVVRIIGRNLTHEQPGGVSLLHGLLRHRVPWIRENEFIEGTKLEAHQLFIEEIRVK